MSIPGRHRAVRIAVFNHKGGVGKTTITLNLAAALGEKGKSVLLVLKQAN
jgi:cellulose biosynthesis protein BcsQ